MSNFTREYERVTCPGCHRSISAYIPHFGDGSGLRVVKHNLLPAARHKASMWWGMQTLTDDDAD